MNWYDKPEWLGFTAAVLKNPDDTTARVVAADWLDDQDEPTASARARLIREQCSCGRECLPLRPGEYAREGLTEPAYQKTAALVVDRGWPLWAVFLPQCFNEHNVSPVFKLAPLTTCTTVGMNAEQSHRQDGFRTVDIYLFHEGPEDCGGFVSSQRELSQHFTPGRFQRLASAGVNLHAEIYREYGYVPAPIFQRLPTEGGAGGTRALRRRDQYPTAYAASFAVMRAAWQRGREWARLPSRVNRHIPKPEAFAVWTVALTTIGNRGRAELDAPPPAPTLAVDPFVFLRDGHRLAREAEKRGRPLSEALTEDW